MKANNNAKTSSTPSELWQALIQSELKSASKLGKAFEKAGFGGCENKVLTLYFEDEDLAKKARGMIPKLKDKLRPILPCEDIKIQIGKVPQRSSIGQSSNKQGTIKSYRLANPLQALNFAEFGEDKKGDELSQPVLAAAVAAEQNNQPLYHKLQQRTTNLVGIDGVTVRASFNWRLRVGGTRGFRELLLPVFHPVFGVPYIPASSLKGAARAWARTQGESHQIQEILGMLDGSTAKAAKVEFLDAFPTKPCLSVDVATPQWHWKGGNVEYKPEPHPLLSMEQPEILVGLRPTKPEFAKYVPLVKDWLENALKVGIGSRVSSGYGKALGQIQALPYHESFKFQLWTQGLYGSEPPTKENGWKGKPEFRPTGVRGILRYWFRAMAMSLYSPTVVQRLEDEVFGQLSKQGKTRVSVLFNSSQHKDPYRYDGQVILEGKEQKYCALLKYLLILACHLGGMGRGSRRPLHLLDIEGNKYIRGCHWEVDGTKLPLEYDMNQWKLMFSELQQRFQAIDSEIGTYSIELNTVKPRLQDSLDCNSQVWLVKSSGQIPPDKVQDWQDEKTIKLVRGKALNLFYSSPKFKGKGKIDGGNALVGGELGVPSFVWIKSIFPRTGDPYQVVSIFGVDQPDRLLFAREIEKLANENPSEALLVYGQMPDGNQPRPNQPRPNQQRSNQQRPNRPVRK